MNFEQCSKCRLTLPNHLLRPAIAMNSKGQKRRVKLCEACQKFLAQKLDNKEK